MYGPSQIRALTGLPQETLRHWRAQLAPLKDRKGACFTATDLLALLVFDQWITQLGLHVGAIKCIAPQLWRACRTPDWRTLESQIILLNIGKKDLQVVSRDKAIDAYGAAIVLPMTDVVRTLQDRLMTTYSEPPQRDWALPPMPMSRPNKNAGLKA